MVPSNGFIIMLLLAAVGLFKSAVSFTTIYENRFHNSEIILRRSLLPNSMIRPSLLLLSDAPTRTFGRSTTASTILHAEGKKDSVTYDGTGRGQYLFVFVLFICIWQFSIPTSFRRAKFCPPACVNERTLCRTPSCVTFDEWSSAIAQYYKDGGGIQWDFSIDPNTLAENERIIQSIFGMK